ncbi:MAG: DUF4389 domain-containing protein [Woeseia sp.]|nr:DUF4389 domain-containing protein [Woeseia sp.]MBT8096987.1 DUF4389 domain-containing protein [Woeseia sp.]NNE62240.1 DUF4389 domain-containing protein [Woeseia sp.]NNL55930.1 DUF4389 domain-containing protein [Woeseia sp.]
MENSDPEKPSEPQAARSTAALEEHVKSRSTWMRLLFIIVCGMLYALSRVVVFVVVLLQFFWLLFTGEPNSRLTATGQSFATYTYQLVRYLTFNTETRPFPFDDDWPSTKPLE